MNLSSENREIINKENISEAILSSNHGFYPTKEHAIVSYDDKITEQRGICTLIAI